jgi:maleamate amidohydrolase
MADDFEDHCWKDIVAPDVLDIYSHYIRKVFVRPSPALLAIDLYELAYQGGARPVADLHRTYASSCGEYAHAAIEPTRRLFAAARAAGLPVFYTTQDSRPDSLPSRVTATRRQNAARDPAVYAIRAEFKPQPGDVVITKQRASAFYGTPLMAHLTQLGIKTVIVCGESTWAACAPRRSMPIPTDSMSCWRRNAASTAASCPTRSTCSICITNMPT